MTVLVLQCCNLALLRAHYKEMKLHERDKVQISREDSPFSMLFDRRNDDEKKNVISLPIVVAHLPAQFGSICCHVFLFSIIVVVVVHAG